MLLASKTMDKYFAQIEKEVMSAYKLAADARKKGHDPEPVVDILLTKNMAQRVEGLVAAVAPSIRGSGIIKRIQELEKKHGKLSWEVVLIIAEEVARQKFVRFKTVKEAMETGIRVGFAYHTVGIVAAPLEGFIELRIKKRRDGREYCAVSYAGPIRGAGGTGAAVSLLIADYVRKKMGYAAYDPDEREINRFITELSDYHERITNLQYNPSGEEIAFLVRNLAVEIDGESTEELEVSNYKDLPRIETNKIRSGVCLVLSMFALKAPKLWKRIELLQKAGFDLGWDFLLPFLKLQRAQKAKGAAGSAEGSIEGSSVSGSRVSGNRSDGEARDKEGGKEDSPARKLTPNLTFISDLVAGRPVLTDPMAAGGLRLRYGRSRLTGFSAAGMHPCTMRLLNNYIATGTQLKVERPGKAAAISPCESIDGPIVLLRDGTVKMLSDDTEAKRVRHEVKEILFLGDILFNYGDFSENNHFLVPAGYCEEWWAQELEAAITEMFGTLDLQRASYLAGIHVDSLGRLVHSPLKTRLSALAAITLSLKLGIPLHPSYTFYWKLVSPRELLLLLKNMRKARFVLSGQYVRMVLPLEKGAKGVLERAGVPHSVSANEYIVLDKQTSTALLATLGIFDKHDFRAEIVRIQALLEKKLEGAEEGADSPEGHEEPAGRASPSGHADDAHVLPSGRASPSESDESEALSFLMTITPVKLRDKAGTFIGARMGRPEKAKMRKLTGSPHVLFPIGEEGGKMRSFNASIGSGKITSDFPLYYCQKHDGMTIYPVCEQCNRKTRQYYRCSECGITGPEACPKHGAKHGVMKPYSTQAIDIPHYFNRAMKHLKLQTPPDLVKGVRGTVNKAHIPENLTKGILRARHDIYVNKDGTTRYDMSELPATHFTPAEIGVSVDKLKTLGYTHDYLGEPLTSTEQLLELMPQDIILPANTSGIDEPADEVLFKIASFVDELLVKFYGLKPYYDFKTKQDCIGTMVIGLAPHISAGMVGRVIGFSNTSVCYAHPLFHAALRRDCDGDELCVLLLMDALLNFSRQYLPDRRGGRTMDAPLILTPKLIPSEVDDMVFGLDVVSKYPLALYQAALEMKYPYEIEVEQLKTRLDTPLEYEKFGFTHESSSMNAGVSSSAYKTLPSMKDKLLGQMAIAERIRAVNEANVATLVIEKHFLKDIRGTLRQFSHQQFRCVDCNAKYRRPPLIGRCGCGGRLLFTVSEGTIVKYLEPSISLAEKYELPAYLRQNLELVQLHVEGIFGRDKEMQAGLGKWF